MIIEIDLATIPPGVRLSDAEDFTRLCVKLSDTDVASISVQNLCALAGAQSQEPAWRSQLDQMVSYARTKGWVTADGELRAHMEWPR